MNKTDAQIKAQFNAVRITKIRIADEVEILYEDPDGDWESGIKLPLDETHGAKNAPTPEFKNSLQDLAPAVCEICEWKKEEAATVNVSAISIKYKGEDQHKTMGVNITATKRLLKTKATMCFNTPYLPEDTKGGGAKLTPEAAIQVHLIIDEARKYLSGARAQMSLPLKDEKQTNILDMRKN